MVSDGKMFEFQVVSPERILFQGEATMVVLPAVSGALGVLANHAPTIVSLGKGIIDVYSDGQIDQRFFVGGGFANITETSCLVMADESISVKDLLEEDINQYIQDTEALIQKAQHEEEKEALRQTASIARSKVEIIELLKEQEKKI